MPGVRIERFPGPPGDAGLAHGRAIAEFFQTGFDDRYNAAVGAVTRCRTADLQPQALTWLEKLPQHFAEEIGAMASGAGVSVARMAAFLYADIARPSTGPANDSPADLDAPPAGPMCSAVVLHDDARSAWAARNCDWLTVCLLRGCSGVVHAPPGRIPAIGVGIRGDIDIDTGMNAAGLWLHLHTLHTTDPTPTDKLVISWLFWAREALETCETLDDLERFCELTARDRGVLAVAVHGPSREAAVFECGRSTSTRHAIGGDAFAGGPAVVTNHSVTKAIDAQRESKARAGGSIGRYCALRRRVERTPPTRFPQHLQQALADPAVEMRTPPDLRTIYSAVCDPAARRLWFAPGTSSGHPAASTGTWSRLRWAW